MPEPSPAPALTLRPPRAGDEAVCRRYHEQLAAEGFSFLLAEGSWEEPLAQVEREAAGTDLPPGRVRADFLLAEVDGDVVGRVSIRHDLNEGLRRFGGHVGYAVAPEHRRRGYATQMLTQAVARLAAEGVSPVLVTCDAGNAASEATILACGGERDADDVLPDGRVKHRFWIRPSARTAPAS